MPDPWNPVRATPEPAPILPRRKRDGRKPSRRSAPREASQPAAEHVGEVDRRGAFGVMIDAVTGREPHEKPAHLRVPETETKRRRRRIGKPVQSKTRGSRQQRPRSGGSAKQ